MLVKIPAALLASLLLLEGGLWLASLWLRRDREAAEAPLAGDAITILCVGDSHTQGAGVAPAEAYPAQLEAALRARHPDRRWRVLNRGFSGLNSAQVANRLERQILQLRPDLVMVWVGRNNRWNVLESESWDESGLGSALHRALLRSRLYRLATVLLHSRSPAADYLPDPEQEAESLREAFREYAAAGMLLDETRSAETVEFDMRRMAGTARALDVAILFVTYPQPVPGRRTDPLNEAIERIGAELGAPVVVTARDRDRALADGLQNRDLFVPFAGPHPTARLYAYIVESMVPVVVEALRAAPRPSAAAATPGRAGRSSASSAAPRRGRGRGSAAAA